MKPLMDETIQPSTELEKSSKKEKKVLGVNYFYALFNRGSKKYKTSLFHTNEKQRKGTQKVPFSVYKKIIKEYFRIYFSDFYFKDNSVYFPWGGYLKKVLYAKWRLKAKSTYPRDFHSSDGAIGLFWYSRPSKRMYYMVRLVKLTGTTNQLPMIESVYKKNKDKDLLPIFTLELKYCTKNRTLFRKL